MEAPIHNPSIFQTPPSTRTPRTFSTHLSLLNVAETLSSFSKASVFNYSYTFDRSKKLNSLTSVRMMHASIIKKYDPDIKISSLITSYLKFADFQSASVLYFMDFPENYLSWKSFLEELTSFGGKPFDIFRVFVELHRKGLSFDSKRLTIVLKMCGNVMDKWLGLEVHAYSIKKGFNLDAHLSCALMNFYEKCWGVDCADELFDKTADLDVVMWNEGILMNLRSERWIKALRLFRNMQLSDVKVNSLTIARVLQACSKMRALDEGKQIHGYVIRSFLQSDLLICNSLISMYSKNENLELARAVFDSMENHNLSSWNSMISSYTSHGLVNEAYQLFHEMEHLNIKKDIVTWNSLLSGHLAQKSYYVVLTILQRMQMLEFKPDSFSITVVLQAISELGFLKLGKATHSYVIRNGLEFDLYIGTSLIDMYVKNDDLTNAQNVFNSMSKRNISAWNSLISGYYYKGCFEDAINVWKRMGEEGIKPDIVTYNAMISGHSIWGKTKEALSIIHEIKNSGLNPNVVSWTALISGSLQNGNYEGAIGFFGKMQQEGVEPNSTTIAIVLQACAGMHLLHKGKEIHCLSIRKGYINDVFVSTALIDMYSKCGSLKDAYCVFQKTHNKTLATWNSMIMGFSIYSLGERAILHFDEMLEEGIKPDAITFTALLSSCKHSGLIEEGWRYFDSMRNYGIIPTIEHYSCMVDLLGRAGYLDEAWEFVQSMPLVPDAAIWGALLGSCRARDDLEIAEIAAKKLFKLEPYNPANYIRLMSLCAISDRFEDVEQIRELMNDKGVRNGHVWSWIQINHKIHHFSAIGEPHPDEGQIYFELYHLIVEMKKLGYVPDISCVYQRMDNREKEKVLLTHTEKLALTYGLMNVKSGKPIRVVKNTRICSDCHEVAKYMTLLSKREILLKDGVRFHKFSEGKCSCKDCW